MNDKFVKVKERIFKPIKEFDVEIRFIENELDSDKSICWACEVGFCVGLGEKSFIYTFSYDDKPTEEEIVKDIKEYLIEERERLNNSLLSAYEEEHLKAINKIKGFLL